MPASRLALFPPRLPGLGCLPGAVPKVKYARGHPWGGWTEAPEVAGLSLDPRESPLGWRVSLAQLLLVLGTHRPAKRGDRMGCPACPDAPTPSVWLPSCRSMG